MMSPLIAISAGLLLISTAVLSEITMSVNYDNVDQLSKKYDVRDSITVECTVKRTENEKVSVRWKKEDKDINSIPEVRERLTETNDGNKFYFKITKATENDAGTYFCIVTKDEEEIKRANITLFSKYRVKTQDNMNFVEGEILRIPCIVYGKPTPRITWKVGNETLDGMNENARIELQRDNEREIDNAIFVIKEARMEDRGIYTCIGTPEVGEVVSDETMVRIKDKYAALWPFLGICAEVFILCAIILIYEKKRNKTELEESDTDQSPDQKNTPDHGKDSNLRHRQ